jgi:hypothetical protein
MLFSSPRFLRYSSAVSCAHRPRRKPSLCNSFRTQGFDIPRIFLHLENRRNLLGSICVTRNTYGMGKGSPGNGVPVTVLSSSEVKVDPALASKGRTWTAPLPSTRKQNGAMITYSVS